MRKNVFIILLILAAWLNFGFDFPQRRSDDVNVSTFKVGSYSNGPIDAGPWQTYICGGHKAQIANSGTITKIKFYLGAEQAWTKIRFKVFRWSSGTTFNFVGESEELTATELSAGEVVYTLSTPITGVQRGDCLGVSYYDPNHNTNVVHYSTGGESGNWYNYYKSEQDVNTSGVSFSTASGINLYIEGYMQAPMWVIAGDSFGAGETACYGRFDSVGTTAWTTFDWESNILGHLADYNSVNFNYMNHAFDGTTPAQWDAWVDDYIIPYHPRFVLWSLGYNPIQLTNSTFANDEDHYTSIVQQCRAADVVPIFMTVLQSNNDLNNVKLPAYNEALKKFCIRQNILCIDGWKTLLAYNSATHARNTTVFGTGFHPDEAAYTAIAMTMLGQLLTGQPQVLLDDVNIASGYAKDANGYSQDGNNFSRCSDTNTTNTYNIVKAGGTGDINAIPAYVWNKVLSSGTFNVANSGGRRLRELNDSFSQIATDTAVLLSYTDPNDWLTGDEMADKTQEFLDANSQIATDANKGAVRTITLVADVNRAEGKIDDINAAAVDANEVRDAVFSKTGITAGGTWTFAKIIKAIAAYDLGGWQDKAGTDDTYQILDAEDQNTAVIEVYLSETSPQKEVTVP